MKFRRNEEDLKDIFLVCVMVGVLGFFMMLKAEPAWLGGMFVASGIILFLGNYKLDGRTITMDESGCEVQIWRIKRRYTWDELKVKRIETIRNLAGCGTDFKEYNEGVIFSTYKIRKPKWMHPNMYEVCRNPFTFFCIYFTPRKRGRITHGKYYYIFEIEETEFLEKMKSWNVELEDARVRYRKRL